jgi:hypothetical protein
MKTILETTDHPIAPPFAECVRHSSRVFLCPLCDSPLEYACSHPENPGTLADLTDDYRCPVGCGSFEYERKRHRLRLLEAGYTSTP